MSLKEEFICIEPFPTVSFPWCAHRGRALFCCLALHKKIVTLSITTFSITELRIIAKCWHPVKHLSNTECCHIGIILYCYTMYCALQSTIFTVMLDVVMLSVVRLNVAAAQMTLCYYIMIRMVQI